MKSWRVLLGQPDRREALAILQLLSFMVCRTLSYRECMLLRLWLLTRVDCCCGGSGCCGSLTEELFLADWSSSFKLAMSFLASTSLFSSVLMASHFVRTRLASSLASFAAFSYSFSFSSTAVQGVSFLFSDFGRPVQVFRGLSVSCHTASGVLCCYAQNRSPGLQRFVGACLVSIGGWQIVYIQTQTTRVWE